MENRREFFETGVHGCLGTLTLAATAATVVTTATASAAAPEEAAAKAGAQRFLLVGLCGSENPTRANFPFVWAAALKEAGHEVRIELAGDGTGDDAHGRGEQRHRRRVAPLPRGARQGGGPQDPDLHLKGLRDRPWGGRIRLRREERAVHEPADHGRDNGLGDEDPRGLIRLGCRPGREATI
jgi:hypothetical protein